MTEQRAIWELETMLTGYLSVCKDLAEYIPEQKERWLARVYLIEELLNKVELAFPIPDLKQLKIWEQEKFNERLAKQGQEPQPQGIP